ncbi:hypothetical protein BDZ89DRAFT_833615 [Hymenopellis radicata]|nr:hypothetical protein BDZ89DRAFT_833615 [Hymenopellis radicata]
MPDPTSTITLKDLKCLDTSLQFIIDHLSLPRLEVVCLSTGREQRDEDSGRLKGFLASFLKMVSRSKCASRIHSLSLKKVPITKDLLSLLSLMPNLVTLNIRAKLAYTTTPDEPEREVTEIIRSLIRELEVKPDQDTFFLPKLQHIAITLSRHVDQYNFPYLDSRDQDDLVRTLQSRWHVESHSGLERLQTFQYWISARDLEPAYYRLTPQTEAALGRLEDEGMGISIRVRSKLVRPDIPSVVVDFGRHSA